MKASLRFAATVSLASVLCGPIASRVLAQDPEPTDRNAIRQQEQQAAKDAAKERREQATKLGKELEEIGQQASAAGLAAKSAAELDEPIQRISKKTMQASMYRSYDAGDALAGLQALQSLQGWLQLRQDFLFKMEAGDLRAARTLLLQSRYPQRESVIPWLARSALLKQYDADLKSCTPEGGELSEVKLTAIGASVLAATEPKAIDPILDSLDKVLRELHAESSNGRGRDDMQQRVSEILEFARKWQNFLAMRARGDVDDNRNLINDLTAYGREYRGIPRSEILAKVYEGKPQKKSSETRPQTIRSFDQILEGIKTLEDLARELPELEKAVTSSNQSQASTSLMDLQSINRSYAEIKSGNASRVSLGLSGFDNTREPARGLRTQVAMFALPRLVSAAEADHPTAGETPLTYLRRLITLGRERKDWQFVSRVLAVGQSTGVTDPVLKSTDSVALTSYISGVTLETARQYALAVTAYQSALKTGSELIPAAEIGDRLQKIEKEHPAEYERGFLLTVTPPLPRTDPMGRPMGVDSNGRVMTMSGMPGFPPQGMPANPNAGKEQPVVVPAKPSVANPVPAAAAKSTVPTQPPAEPATNAPTTAPKAPANPVAPEASPTR